MIKPPRAFNRNIFDDDHKTVFYGTDDGRKDGSFSEFTEFEEHYQQVDPSRKGDIHMISVVGGLYGLNLIPLWQPKRITFFDINPKAVLYFKIIYRVLTTSEDAAHFLDRLSTGDYETTTDDEDFIKENIILKRKGILPESRGASERSFEQSWKMALERFDLTKQILLKATVDIRTEPIESDSFKDLIRENRNVWIYVSNITQFHFFDLEIPDPVNVVILQIDRERSQLLDLVEYGGKRVKVKFRIAVEVVK